MDFSGKTVLVTGPTRGIGLAIARAFLDQGARVAVNGRRAEEVNLGGADLTGADLSKSDFEKADLRDARLVETVLCGADLEKNRPQRGRPHKS